MPLVRLSDGGYCDNTAVAYTMRFLQGDGRGDGFNIVAFDNTDEAKGFGDGAMLGSDVAQLFGVDSDQLCMGSYCITATDRKIFLREPLDSAKPIWTYESRGVSVSYVRFSVETYANASFGVVGGRKGTFHLFTSVAPDAPAAPVSMDTFAAYEDLLDVVYEGITEHGGWEHLRDAMRL